MSERKSVVLVNIVRKLDDLGNYPPLSTAFIKAYCDTFEDIKKNFDITLYTSAFDDYKPEKLLAHIKEKNPCIVGFSCYTWNLRQYLEVVPRIKEIAPDILTAMGGPEAHPGLMKMEPGIDLIVIGEGENPFKELLERTHEGRPWRETRGTAYLDDNGIHINELQDLLEDIDLIPSPYKLGILPKTPIRHLEYSRGCTNNCRYCVDSKEPYRHMSIERVEEEIRDCVESGAQLGLTAGSYLNYRDFGVKVLQIIKKYREMGHDITIGDTLCVDANNDDEKFYNLLDEIVPDKKELALTIGIQCTHPEPLKMNRRVTRMDKVRNVFTKWNFTNLAQLIIGLPGDNIFRIAHTIAESVKLKPHFLQTFPMLIIPNTYLFENKEEFSIVADEMPPHEPSSIFGQDKRAIDKFQMMANSCAMEYNCSNNLT